MKPPSTDRCLAGYEAKMWPVALIPVTDRIPLVKSMNASEQRTRGQSLVKCRQRYLSARTNCRDLWTSHHSIIQKPQQLLKRHQETEQWCRMETSRSSVCPESPWPERQQGLRVRLKERTGQNRVFTLDFSSVLNNIQSLYLMFAFSPF